MADALLRFGNGSGGGSDETTATKNQVLRGVTAITSDSGDEPVEGTIITRGYRGPDSNEMWLYPQEGGYVVRLEEGFYHKDSGSQLKPYVIAPTNLVKSAVNYRAEYTLNNTTTCGEQGKIKMINTQDNGYAINHANVFALDAGRGKLVILLGHGNGYYYRPDGNPHVEVNASELGNAVKESLLQWQTASSMYGINFQGTIPRWICGTGDVISAVDNNGFAWDDSTGANRGRGIVTRIPNGHYIQGANYVFLPSPNLYPHNIRAGVNIHGVVGTMPDYSTGRTVFNGATFDGTLLSGVANKDFFIINDHYPRYRASNYAYTGIYDGGINLNLNTSMPSVRGRYIGFVFSQSVNLAPFNRIDIYWRFLGDRRNRASMDLYAGVSKASSLRRSAMIVGSTPVDGFAEGNIRSYANGISNGGSGKIELYVGEVHEQAFLYLYANASIGGSADLVNGRIQITRIDFLN